MQITAEQMQKAKQAKTAEELLTIAKENGVELTEEQASEYFAELHKEGELTDDELDAVAGGKDPDPKFSEYETVCFVNNTRYHATVLNKELRNGSWWYFVEFINNEFKGRQEWYPEELLGKC